MPAPLSSFGPSSRPSQAPISSVGPGNTGGARAENDNGTLGIRLLTPRASVHEGDPVTVFTTFGYVGKERSVDRTTSARPVAFQLDQLDAKAPQALGVIIDYADCTDTVLRPGSYADVAPGPITRVTGDEVSGNWIDEHFDGSKLRLPVGRWRITASIVGSTQAVRSQAAQCRPDLDRGHRGAGRGGGIRLLTATSPPAASDGCPVNAATGTLALQPISGLGLEMTTGNVMPVRWPFDVSVEQRPEGAVLYDDLGFPWAVEGQQLNSAAASNRTGSSLCASRSALPWILRLGVDRRIGRRDLP